jgi:hypothetical protein
MTVPRGELQRYPGGLTRRIESSPLEERNSFGIDRLLSGVPSTWNLEVTNEENALLELIRAVNELAEDGSVQWAIDLNSGGAALLITLLLNHQQELLYTSQRYVTSAARETRSAAAQNPLYGLIRDRLCPFSSCPRHFSLKLFHRFGIVAQRN